MVGPLLVTGVPRSGTTWLARRLASAAGTALTGREPMNPRGRQYALAGTLSGWARLTAPTRQQEVALRRAYRGYTPRVYSRYGYRQWAVLAPRTTVVVKDPFAMLSIPTVHRTTGARSVLLYRHPGAVFASYQRMRWSPDVEELQPIVKEFVERHGHQPGVHLAPDESTAVARMGWFWNVLYAIALHDIAPLTGEVTVLDHEDVATGGQQFAVALFNHLGLSSPAAEKYELKSRGVDTEALHNLNRDPAKVAGEWEDKISREERDELNARTEAVRTSLQDRRFCLPNPG